MGNNISYIAEQQEESSRPSNNKLFGIGLMLISTICFAIMGIFIRELSEQMHSTQIVFVRNILTILFLLPLVFYHGIPSLKTKYIKMHFWRGILGLGGMELWFYCMTQMPLNEAVALSFTAPLFTTIIAVLFLKESIGPRRIAALMVGFVGVMIIIRPSPEESLQVTSLLVLAASILWASASIFVKQLTKVEAPWKIVFHMSILMSVFSFPTVFIWWEDITSYHMIMLLAISTSGLAAQWLLAKAFSKTDLVTLMPLDFNRLIFTAILAYMFLGEIIDMWTIVGAIIIGSSCFYIAVRSRESKDK